MKKNIKTYLSFILIALAAVVLIVFEFCDFSYSDDETLNALLNGFIPRLITGVLLIAIMWLLDYGSVLIPNFKRLPAHLLWCIPCFLVIIANFPFSALITGTAQILRTDLIALFILKCFAIGLMEEALFRGLLQLTIAPTFENKPHGKLLTVFVSSALFGLIHLLNLFSGAGIGATFLQVGYSFLIGAMLSAVIIKTNNFWLCVLLHAVFDVGGNLIEELGDGTPWDLWFWIFTAVAGVVCFVHVLYFLVNEDKKNS